VDGEVPTCYGTCYTGSYGETGVMDFDLNSSVITSVKNSYEYTMLYIRNCSAYSVPMTSHALGGLAGSCCICRYLEIMTSILSEIPTPAV